MGSKQAGPIGRLLASRSVIGKSTPGQVKQAAFSAAPLSAHSLMRK